MTTSRNNISAAHPGISFHAISELAKIARNSGSSFFVRNNAAGALHFCPDRYYRPECESPYTMAFGSPPAVRAFATEDELLEFARENFAAANAPHHTE